MKIFQNEKIFKKLVILLLIITIVGFVKPKTVEAKEIGGELLNPVMSLFVTIGDGVISIIQKVVLDMDDSIIDVDAHASWFAKFIVILGIAVVAAFAVAAVIISAGGLSIAIIPGLIRIGVGVAAAIITFPVSTFIVEGMLPDTFYLPFFEITPHEIFANELPLLDVDFFHPNDAVDENSGTKYVQQSVDKNGKVTEKEVEYHTSTAYQLRGIIGNWYVILRNIALVAMLSTLVYIGIRIIISSTAVDKAKYKQNLSDWLIALCLLFTMQYIMSFSNIVVKKITSAVDIESYSKLFETDEDGKIKKDSDGNAKLKSGSSVSKPEMFTIKDKTLAQKAYKKIVNADGKDDTSNPYYKYFVKTDNDGNITDKAAGADADTLMWPADNFMQQARLNLQFLNEDKEETYLAIGWKLIYIMLVIYTVVFLFTYLRRVIYMAFLTLIAPLVAMTYPLDKLRDGKAQAFDMWFKEYEFNLLLQPMHLILYTVLISSAMTLASKHILYVIVALGFMVPAETLLRRFFGFESAKTPGLLAGPVGAGLSMAATSKIFRPKPPKGAPGGKAGAGAAIDDKGKTPRFSSNFDKTGALAGINVGAGNRAGAGARARAGAGGAQGGNANGARQIPDGAFENAINEYADNLDGTNLPGDNLQGGNIPIGTDADNDYLDWNMADNALENNTPENLGDTPGANIPIGTEADDDYIDWNMRNNNAGANGANNNANAANNNISEAEAYANRGKPRKLGRAVWTAAKRYTGARLSNWGDDIRARAAHPVRKAMKFAAGATAAGIGATGAAIGTLATGDPNKIATNALGGAAAGYKLGSEFVPDASNQPTGAQEAFEKEMRGDDGYEQKQKDDYIKQIRRNSEYKDKARRKLGPSGAKELLNKDNTYIKDYTDAGIKDFDDMITAYDLEKNGLEVGGQRKTFSRDEAIAEVGWANELADVNYSKMTAKKQKEQDDTIRKKFAENADIKSTGKDPNALANDTIEVAKAINKKRNK